MGSGSQWKSKEPPPPVGSGSQWKSKEVPPPVGVPVGAPYRPRQLWASRSSRASANVDSRKVVVRAAAVAVH